MDNQFSTPCFLLMKSPYSIVKSPVFRKWFLRLEKCLWLFPVFPGEIDKWVWVKTYRYIFSGMNIHLPAILGFTRYQGFDPSPNELLPLFAFLLLLQKPPVVKNLSHFPNKIQFKARCAGTAGPCAVAHGNLLVGTHCFTRPALLTWNSRNRMWFIGGTTR